MRWRVKSYTKFRFRRMKMPLNYGTRYMQVKDFVKYCDSLNVKTDEQELEYYEKKKIMHPVARIVYPEEYIIQNDLWYHSITTEYPNPKIWPDIQKLSDKQRRFPEQYADMQDEELIDSFDREFGHNSYLVKPSTARFKPWNSFLIEIPIRDGIHHSASLAEHYYAYWQVHQLSNLQNYPDLYKNKFFIDHIGKETLQKSFHPIPPKISLLREFNGLSKIFDLISYWIVMYTRERDRTFALIPLEHNIKKLNKEQLDLYQIRLKDHAKFIRSKYKISINMIYLALSKLIGLYDEYQKDEHYKLAEELRNDIIYFAHFVELISGDSWESIGDKLGKKYSYWTKQHFLHLDISIKESDEARDLFKIYTDKYAEILSHFNILNPTFTFSGDEIDELLKYCNKEGFFILTSALSGMIYTSDDVQKKFRRVYLYTNLKNAITSLEYLLKEFARLGNIDLSNQTLTPIILRIMKRESWISLFNNNLRLTKAKDSIEFFNNLSLLINDKDLIRSEESHFARTFLIVTLARNLTVHNYPQEDWFYAEYFNEMLQAIVFALLLSWKKGRKEGWV
jgi:hypothetical protein